MFPAVHLEAVGLLVRGFDAQSEDWIRKGHDGVLLWKKYVRVFPIYKVRVRRLGDNPPEHSENLSFILGDATMVEHLEIRRRLHLVEVRGEISREVAASFRNRKGNMQSCTTKVWDPVHFLVWICHIKDNTKDRTPRVDLPLHYKALREKVQEIQLKKDAAREEESLKAQQAILEAFPEDQHTKILEQHKGLAASILEDLGGVALDPAPVLPKDRFVACDYCNGTGSISIPGRAAGPGGVCPRCIGLGMVEIKP